MYVPKSYLLSPFNLIFLASFDFFYGFSLSIFDRSRVHFMSSWCQIFRLGDFSISRSFPVSPSFYCCRDTITMSIIQLLKTDYFLFLVSLVM